MLKTIDLSSAFSICQWAESHETPVIIITPDLLTNNRLTRELEFFRSPTLPVLNFPDWETLPYDNFSPHQDIISERLKALSLLPGLKKGILLVTVNTLMQKLPPPEFIHAHAFCLNIHDTIILDDLKQRFALAGYRSVSQVLAPGEFAVRGSLFDIYPMGAPLPFRIDLLDTQIDSIRTFDPETQRTLTQLNQINVLPAREFPFDTESITLFRQQWREQFEGNPAHSSLYETISQGSLTPGIEYYFPLFFPNTHTVTLCDYWPATSTVLTLEKLSEQANHFYHEIKSRYEQLRHDRQKPILPPDKLFLSPDKLFSYIKHNNPQKIKLVKYIFPDILMDSKSNLPLNKLKNYLQNLPDSKQVLFCVESTGRREALLTLFRPYNINPVIIENWSEFMTTKPSLAITTAPLEQGLEINHTIIIPENSLVGDHIIQHRRQKSKTSSPDTIIKNLAELTIGSPVVHIEHGVGRYLGLILLTLNNNTGEYLLLEYANDAKLYVPVSALHLIHRYSGVDADQAPLHKLGSDQWEKARRKAAEKIRDTAAELLTLHAQREARPGLAYSIDTSYSLFANSFPFEETLDQQNAIHDVIKDMQAEKSMDRLICGDVGFGKTEVAMRAAFIAVHAGYQVAILVPTTLLAQQHYQNFCDRFADWPVKIDMVSRFKTAPEQVKILEALKTGKLDIIIGTHKLLQPDVTFKQLGLVIIDEEHRFGVRQKERLKSLRAEVDILTLTATPIPRTLNIAMSGMRDLSIIGTPPRRRLAIKTFVHEHDSHLIREAVLREIMRGGQVFYLHNTVDTIIPTAEKLRELIPEARIAVAHGQMRERELEIIMREFYHQHSNILVCTTIIENGIDIPSANTIIIDRADKLGLSQLHQLRGRVGRSHHQAYAFLLTPHSSAITDDAKKRLEAISQLEDLGVGFALATHDLEIRGAGALLGEEQSGEMQEIGFSLYIELLEKAVKTLKSGGKLDFLNNNLSYSNHINIDLQIPAFIPENYIPDVHTRLVLYKRIADCETPDALRELQVEFIDRFGLMPEGLHHLFSVTNLKLMAEKLGIKKIKSNPTHTLIEFNDNPPIDSAKLFRLIQTQYQLYKLDGPNKIKIIKTQPSAEIKLNTIQEFMQVLL